MAGELSGGYKSIWYCYGYGPAHVIMLNTEIDFESAPTEPETGLADLYVMIACGKSSSITTEISTGY